MVEESQIHEMSDKVLITTQGYLIDKTFVYCNNRCLTSTLLVSSQTCYLRTDINIKVVFFITIMNRQSEG